MVASVEPGFYVFKCHLGLLSNNELAAASAGYFIIYHRMRHKSGSAGIEREWMCADLFSEYSGLEGAKNSHY